jgi:hypothetical protein
MTFDSDFDIPIEKEWLILMKQLPKYELELWLTKREENGFIKIFIEVRKEDIVIFNDKGLEESTEPYYRVLNFLKKYLEVDYL